MVTPVQKVHVKRLRGENRSYVLIARELGLSISAVKGYCQRNGLSGKRATIWKASEKEETLVCLGCGTTLIQRQGVKQRKFCSSDCRQAWWNAHPEKVNRKAVYQFTCDFCGKQFTAYGNRNRKYCSHDCYIRDRYKAGVDR